MYGKATDRNEASSKRSARFHALSMGFAFVLCSSLSCSSWAQTLSQGVVATEGTADVIVRAQYLRVHVELLGQGDDLQEALAVLSRRQEAAEDQLKRLGVSPEDVEVEEAVISTDRFQNKGSLIAHSNLPSDPGRRSPTLAPLPRQNRSGFSERLQPIPFSPELPDRAPEPKPLRPIVSAHLTADVPLATPDGEAPLVVAEALKAKIVALDLAGRKQLDPGVICRACGAKLGQPSFLFVARVTPKECASALRNAFQKARDSAARLTIAAGQELGPVRQINSRNSAPALPGLPLDAGITQNDTSFNGNAEVTGPRLGRLVYSVTIFVEFSLQDRSETIASDMPVSLVSQNQ